MRLNLNRCLLQSLKHLINDVLKSSLDHHTRRSEISPFFFIWSERWNRNEKWNIFFCFFFFFLKQRWMDGFEKVIKILSLIFCRLSFYFDFDADEKTWFSCRKINSWMWKNVYRRLKQVHVDGSNRIYFKKINILQSN